jgi:hypothetical protein
VPKEAPEQTVTTDFRGERSHQGTQTGHTRSLLQSADGIAIDYGVGNRSVGVRLLVGSIIYASPGAKLSIERVLGDISVE